MALTITLTYSNESPSGDIFVGTITDSTTYGTGGNPARAAVAVYLTGTKVKVDSSADYTVDIVTYDPTTASSFAFDIDKDGWYQFYFVVVPDHDNAVTYDIYDAVFYNAVVYRAIQDGFSGQLPTNTSFWEVISSPTSLIDNDGTATESGNLQFEIFDQIIYPYSKTKYGDASETAALDCCSDCERSEQVEMFELARVMCAGMDAANTRQLWAKGEKMARKMDEFVA